MTITKVFLDLYGTLTSGDGEAIEAICKKIIADLGLSISVEKVKTHWGKHIWAAVELSYDSQFRSLAQLEAESLVKATHELGYEIDPHPYIYLLEAYWRSPHFYSDALHFLQNINLPVCIVSNSDRINAETALRHLGGTYTELITSEDARCYKPNPKIFEFALAKTGWPLQEIIHIGDSIHGDIKPARDIGFTTGLIIRANRPFDPGKHFSDVDFNNLFEALDYLKCMN